MILDGEEDEALRVLLEEGLVGLLRLDGRGHAGLGLLLLREARLLLLSGIHLGLERGEVGIEGGVLLVGAGEVKLLDGRLHLEVLDGGSSLRKDASQL